MPNTFTIGEALRFGWEKTKKHFGFLVLVMVASWLASALVSFLTGGMQEDASAWTVIGGIVSFVFGIIIEVGIIRITIKILDDVRGGIDDFKVNWDIVWRLVLGCILYGLIVIVGLVLLIVPGIIFAIRYYFYAYLIIDKGMQPMEALKASAKMTQGEKGHLFLYALATIGVTLLGFLVILIGLLWAVPTVAIATTWIYRKLLPKLDAAPVSVAPAAAAV